MKRTAGIAVVCAFLGFSLALTQESVNQDSRLTAAEIIEKSQLAFYYQGEDMKARMTMELINQDGAKRRRVMTMLRHDQAEGGNQRYFIYFHEPGDVRRMTFMVWKYPEKEDTRWIYVSALDLIRRIASDDKRSSFVGSDFTYEDISGRDVDSDSHSLLREEKFGERDCYVIQSIPKTIMDYTKRLSWIDKENFLPLQEEYYDAQQELYRVFTADEVQNIAEVKGESSKAFPTVTKRTMKNVKSGHRTEVTYGSVTYNLGLEENDFSERRMRRPPRSWIE